MNYFLPRSVPEALAALRHSGTQIVCGGTDSYATARPLSASGLVDITRIPSLRGIESREDWMRIGATTTWADLADGARGELPSALLQAARLLGSRQVRTRGTIGGNLCQAASAADGVPPLLILGACVEIVGPDGSRELELSEFLQGRRSTALRRGELLTCVKFPHPLKGCGTAFHKMGNRAGMSIAVVSVAVSIQWSSDARVRGVRVAVGAASPVAVRLHSLEERLIGLRPSEIATKLSAVILLPELSPISDLRASAAFRHRMAVVAVRRACASVEPETIHESL
jgi:CO/xanthine dehydrogenase FAD-binding subunit